MDSAPRRLLPQFASEWPSRYSSGVGSVGTVADFTNRCSVRLASFPSSPGSQFGGLVGLDVAGGGLGSRWINGWDGLVIILLEA
jgi:hypothetical protein